MASTAADPSCPICRGGQPLDLIGELLAVWVTAPPLAPLPGYVCVVAKRHVAEPFQLPQAEMEAFWSECMSVALVLHDLVRPLKMNYEIHGNSIPHLHLHLYPRFRGDPYEGRAIDGRSTGFERSPEDLERIRGAIDLLCLLRQATGAVDEIRADGKEDAGQLGRQRLGEVVAGAGDLLERGDGLDVGNFG
jgi:diadenosine tetraphosphate (Ap4A) HIT family hydrolase